VGRDVRFHETKKMNTGDFICIQFCDRKQKKIDTDVVGCHQKCLHEEKFDCSAIPIVDVIIFLLFYFNTKVDKIEVLREHCIRFLRIR